MKNEIVGTCRWCEKPVLRSKKFTVDCYYPMGIYHIKCFPKIIIENKVLTGIAPNDRLA